MTQERLKEVLEEHLKWLKSRFTNEVIGQRADLTGADLTGANLTRADLTGADLTGADLTRADLRGADLTGANLTGADLRDADLDYSCLPLWCGSLKAHFDDKQITQILYHVLSATINSKNVSKELKEKLLTTQNLEIANNFHRVNECGTLIKEEENE